MYPWICTTSVSYTPIHILYFQNDILFERYYHVVIQWTESTCSVVLLAFFPNQCFMALFSSPCLCWRKSSVRSVCGRCWQCPSMRISIDSVAYCWINPRIRQRKPDLPVTAEEGPIRWLYAGGSNWRKKYGQRLISFLNVYWMKVIGIPLGRSQVPVNLMICLVVAWPREQLGHQSGWYWLRMSWTLRD